MYYSELYHSQSAGNDEHGVMRDLTEGMRRDVLLHINHGMYYCGCCSRLFAGRLVWWWYAVNVARMRATWSEPFANRLHGQLYGRGSTPLLFCTGFHGRCDSAPARFSRNGDAAGGAHPGSAEPCFRAGRRADASGAFGAGLPGTPCAVFVDRISVPFSLPALCLNGGAWRLEKLAFATMCFWNASPQQGESALEMYFIVKGLVVEFRITDSDEQVEDEIVATYTAGQHFGEQVCID
jgi:hypothetical protein